MADRRGAHEMDYGELVSLNTQCPHLDNVFGPAGLHSPSTLRHLASWSSWTYAVLYDLFCIHIGHPNPLGMHAVELLEYSRGFWRAKTQFYESGVLYVHAFQSSWDAR